MLRLFNSYMPDDLPELNKILHSGNISYGFYGNLFEEKLRNKLDNPYVLTTSNFFYAVSVALSTFGLRAGDEVIISPLNCLAAVMPYKNYGLEINFVDINIFTGTLDIDCVKKSITNKTKLIVLSHYCGYQGDIEEFRKIVNENNIFLINDCFEAFMSFDNRIKNSGALSNEAFVYHFGPTKLPNTIDGGCVEFFSESFFYDANKIRDLGIDRKLFRKSNGEIDENYDVEFNSYGAMMSEVNSYIGICQLQEVPKLKRIMKQNYYSLLFELDLILKFDYELLKNFSKTNYWLFGVLSKDKKAEFSHLREKIIHVSEVHVSLERYTVFDKNQMFFPNIRKFENQFIAIPTGWWYENKKFQTTFQREFFDNNLECARLCNDLPSIIRYESKYLENNLVTAHFCCIYGDSNNENYILIEKLIIGDGKFSTLLIELMIEEIKEKMKEFACSSMTASNLLNDVKSEVIYSNKGDKIIINREKVDEKVIELIKEADI